MLEPYYNVVFTITSKTHNYSEYTEAGRRKNLIERCNVANKIKGKVIFISIHANAFSNPSVSGYEIFVYKHGSEAHEIAKHVLNAGKDILGVGTEIKNRGIKEANFIVLTSTKMPAILIEHEFYTNIEAVKKLKDKEFRYKCAKHILSGINSYLNS